MGVLKKVNPGERTGLNHVFEFGGMSIIREKKDCLTKAVFKK